MSPVMLLSLGIVAILALLIWGGYEIWKVIKKGKGSESELNKLRRTKQLQEAILTYLVKEGKKKYKQVKDMGIYKIRLIEKYDLKPAELKSVLADMVRDKLVTEEQETYSVTPFGIEYYNVFILARNRRKK